MGKIELFTKMADFYKKIVPSINNMFNDDQFRNDLTKAGGLISLVAVSLDAYDRIHKSLQTNEERGLDSLNRFLWSTTEEVLKEISKGYLKNEDINIDKDFDKKKETIDELFKSFKAGSYDDGIFYFFPYRFPPVIMFKSIIKSKLEEKYQNNKEIIEFFDKKFEPTLKININNNDNIQNFLSQIKNLQQEELKIDYLQQFLEYTIERSSLNNYYYVGKRQAVLADKHTWTRTNKEIEEEKDVIKEDAEEIIHNFIKKAHRTKHYMFIAAPFGIGKTFLIKKISSDYATKYLQNESHYIPIVVYLGEAGLEGVYEDENIDRVLEELTPSENNKVSDVKILLILDGLDEYKGKLSDLMTIIKSKMEKYTFHKVILTTRLLSNLHNELPGIENYMRLLPFTKEQVNEFFGQTNEKLTYEGARKSRLNEEEITKPLLAWMLSQIPAITESLGDLRLSEEKLTGNETRSLIYLHFFHHIIAGKPVDPTKGKDKNIIRRRYIAEKKALRKIAILKQIEKKDKITLEDYKKEFPDDPKDSPVLNQIFKSYFYIGDERDDDKETTIAFEHTTYRDYLISEYYLEYFLKKDKEETEDAMNIGVPSPTTLEFLEGLVGLLKSEDRNIKKLLEYDIDNISLLNSFEYSEGLDNAREQIKNTALNLINKQINSPINYNKTGESEEKKSDDVELSIDKWISLCILNILIPGKISTEVDKKILSKLIRETSQQISNPTNPAAFKKLKQLDLSGEDLSGADLIEADLFDTNLSHAYLGRVPLSNANLSNANLSNANLNDADLTKANLTNANLSHANLNDADLTDADLTKANLTDADLTEAKMTGSKLIEATLIEADLSCTNLSSANLNYANLNDANFWRANLSHAKLISSKLIYTQLTRANLNYADLTGADLSHANLTKTDMNNTTLKNAIFANAYLYHTKLSDSDLSNVNLSNAYLPYVTAKNVLLCDSNLSKTYISESDFSGSKLSNACFDNTTLSHVNLSYCVLISSKMTNITNYDYLKCKDSDFKGSSIDSQDIIDYLNDNYALNVPRQTSPTSITV
jgi:uncharacterized protein YjbI with pentapeptide repeats